MSDETERINELKNTARKGDVAPSAGNILWTHFTGVFKRKTHGSFLLHEPIMRYYIFFMIVLAQYSPLDVLDQYSFLKEFTDAASKIIPVINTCTAESKFPQVTRLYMSISWLFSPLSGYFLWKEYKTNASDQMIKLKNVIWDRKNRIKAWICVFFIPISSLSYPFIPICHDWELLPYNHSRIVLGVAGHFLYGAVVPAGVISTYIFFLKLKNQNS